MAEASEKIAFSWVIEPVDLNSVKYASSDDPVESCQDFAACNIV